MDKQLIPFDYQGKEVRSIEIDGKPYFVGSDIATTLGYARPADAISAHCKGTVKRRIPTNGGMQEMNVISIGDVCRLTANSELPGADKFESWIFDTVIPQVLQTGTYTAKPMSQAEIIAAQANLLVEVERKSTAALESADHANKRLDNALNALSKPSEPDWQTSTGNRIKAVAAENQLSYLKFFGDLYKELEDTARVNLTSRVSRMKERMKKAGHTYKELDKVTKLHVISCDPVLKLAFDGVVRRCEAKYATAKIPYMSN